LFSAPLFLEIKNFLNKVQKDGRAFKTDGLGVGIDRRTTPEGRWGVGVHHYLDQKTLAETNASFAILPHPEAVAAYRRLQSLKNATARALTPAFTQHRTLVTGS
jgi:hypothetical protein